MADFGIWIKNSMIQAKTGVGANATANAIAATDIYVLGVEAFINAFCRFNWSDAVTAGLNADTQGILEDVGANLCAIYVVQWDTSGYASRTEAENIINVCRDAALRGLGVLRDKKTQDFINGA